MKRPITLAWFAALLLTTTAYGQDATAHLRLVHAMPGASTATLLVDGLAVHAADVGAAGDAYLPVPAGTPLVAAEVDGVRAEAPARDLRSGFRYLAVLHRGADGAPTVLVLPGLSGRTLATAVLLRAVNLVPELERVRVVHVDAQHVEGVAPCAGTFYLAAQPYANAGPYEPYEFPYRGPTTLCASDEALLPTEPELPVGTFHAELGQSMTVYVVQGVAGVELVKIEDTP